MSLIVKDSSVWYDAYGHAANNRPDCRLKVGIVRDIIYNNKLQDDVRYLVEVNDNGVHIPITCTQLQKFGGVNNYEEFIYRDYQPSDGPTNQGPYNTKAGDVVLVSYIYGDPREGIILGSLKHSARKRKLNSSDGISYVAEFNGVETSINNSGEYRVTFRGIPTNISALSTPPNGAKVPKPIYNTTVGTSYLLMDKFGSLSLSDNAVNGVQGLSIDKPSGTVTLASNSVKLMLNKVAQSTVLDTKTLTVNASSAIAENTADYTLKASATTRVISPRIAIGSDGVELLDNFVKLIEQLGTLTVISPVGICAPLSSTPQWGSVLAIKSAINGIKGSL